MRKYAATTAENSSATSSVSPDSNAANPRQKANHAQMLPAWLQLGWMAGGLGMVLTANSTSAEEAEQTATPSNRNSELQAKQSSGEDSSSTQRPGRVFILGDDHPDNPPVINDFDPAIDKLILPRSIAPGNIKIITAEGDTLVLEASTGRVLVIIEDFKPKNSIPHEMVGLEHGAVIPFETADDCDEESSLFCEDNVATANADKPDEQDGPVLMLHPPQQPHPPSQSTEMATGEIEDILDRHLHDNTEGSDDKQDATAPARYLSDEEYNLLADSGLIDDASDNSSIVKDDKSRVDKHDASTNTNDVQPPFVQAGEGGKQQPNENNDDNSNLEELLIRNPVLGSFGDDVLIGTDGPDFLRGFLGTDSMTGGDGSDLFMLRDEPTDLNLADIITDFTRGEDLLVFHSDIDEVYFERVDKNGDGIAEQTVLHGDAEASNTQVLGILLGDHSLDNSDNDDLLPMTEIL